MPFSKDTNLDNWRVRITSKINSALRSYSRVELNVNQRQRSRYMSFTLILDARREDNQKRGDKNLDALVALNANQRS